MQKTGKGYVLRPHHLAWGAVYGLLLIMIGTHLYHRYQQAALFRAAEQGDIVRLERLLKQGLDPNSKRQYVSESRGIVEESPLLLAARRGHWKAVQFLLKSGADVN